MKKLNPKAVFLPALALFLICLVVTAALAVVNRMTASPIATNEQADADAARTQMFPGATFEQKGGYFVASQNGRVVGYCMETQAQGYGGAIRLAVGLNANGAVRRVQVLSAENETPGLGLKVEEESFLQQFSGLRGEAVLGGGIDGIASATYSSRGVVEAVNLALQLYQSQIAGGDVR